MLYWLFFSHKKNIVLIKEQLWRILNSLRKAIRSYSNIVFGVWTVAVLSLKTSRRELIKWLSKYLILTDKIEDQKCSLNSGTFSLSQTPQNVAVKVQCDDTVFSLFLPRPAWPTYRVPWSLFYEPSIHIQPHSVIAFGIL